MLRRAAEARLKEMAATRLPVSKAVQQRIQQELEIHQIELEMQNDELRQTQVQLDTALARYTDLYEFAPVGYLTIRPDGAIQQINLAAASLLGTKRLHLMGWCFGAFVAAEALADFNALLVRAIETKTSEVGEVGLSVKGKPPLTVQLRISVSADGQECRLVLIDITERKRLEEALQQSEIFAKSVLNALTANIAVVDEQGTIVAVNEAWKRFARENGGVDPDGYVGTNYLAVCHASLQEGPDALVEAALRGINAVMRDEQEEFDVEYPCHSLDKQRWFKVCGTRFVGESSGHVVVAHQDITERKEAEEKLRQLSARLLRLHDEERRQMVRELHDVVGQNLAALTMNLSFLAKGAPRLWPEARQALLDSEVLAIQTAKEVRTFSYLLHPPLLDEMGLGGALREYIPGFARRSGIHVDLQLAAEFKRMPEETELALFRVIQESLSNIHRHSGSKTACVTLNQTTDEVQLEVRDAGRGFALKPSESAGPASALGVGITGMQERLRQLGGRLHLRSNSDGTIVRATLPCVRKIKGNSQ